MKLYFYNLNLSGKHNKKIGIRRYDCDVVETQKRYSKADKSDFPNCSKYVRKDDLSKIHYGWIILAEPNFAFVKEKFATLMASEKIRAQVEARRYARLEKSLTKARKL